MKLHSQKIWTDNCALYINLYDKDMNDLIKISLNIFMVIQNSVGYYYYLYYLVCTFIFELAHVLIM